MFVASEVFVDAAQKQGEALGFQPERLFVEHPIQDRTDDEMIAYADAAFEQIVSQVTAG